VNEGELAGLRLRFLEVRGTFIGRYLGRCLTVLHLITDELPTFQIHTFVDVQDCILTLVSSFSTSGSMRLSGKHSDLIMMRLSV
jgi:hypothetical protein